MKMRLNGLIAIKRSEESNPDIEEGWYIEHKEKLKKFSNEKPSWEKLWKKTQKNSLRDRSGSI